MSESLRQTSETDRSVGNHAAALRAAFEAARADHPTVHLSYETFATCVLRATSTRLARAGIALSRVRMADALSRAAVSDLYLAIACEEGSPQAWDSLTARYVPLLTGRLRGRGLHDSEAREVAEQVPGEAFAPPPTGSTRTRIGTYSGAGSLLGWLSVMAQRRHADQFRLRERALRSREVGALPHRAAMDRAEPAVTDPASKALDAEIVRILADGLEDAWSSLTPRERLAMLFKYRNGLPQQAIARLLAVGSPRVSRLVESGTRKVRDAVLRRMPAAVRDDVGRAWHALHDALARHLTTLGARDDLRAEEGGPS